MTKHWLVKHDRKSIEYRPGWAWRNADAPKKSFANLKQIGRGDKFVLYAFETSERKDSKPCSEIFGFYRVTSSVSPEKIRGDNFWVVKGTPLLQEGWVTCPSATAFFTENKYHGQGVVPLLRGEYDQFLNYYRRYKDANWGVLDHEPSNEQELVIIFSRYIDALGFKKFDRVETRRTPDAVLIRKNGRQVKVEFELYSSGLEAHTLKGLRGAICVCWVDDLPPSSKYRRIPIRPIKEEVFKILNPAAL